MKLLKNMDEIIATPTVSIVSATGPHIAYLKKNLRAEDEAEILNFGVTVQHALWRTYRNSLVRKTALIDGVPVACWGVCGTFMGSIGRPWLMTTPGVKKVSPLKFTRVYQKETLEMLKMFPRLENYVDSGYDNAIRLLEIIGFRIGEPEQMGNGMYCKFSIGK